MSLLSKFTKLMKGEQARAGARMRNPVWVIDESKCLSISEVRKLRAVALQTRDQGVEEARFSLVRNWFMIELGLQAGLRVGEMVSLTHGQVLLDNGRSSLLVHGKGGKKRAVWISASFKHTCLQYAAFKQDFGFPIDADSPVLSTAITL